jgi:hypothetical protein
MMSRPGRHEMGGECMQLNRVTWGGVSGLLGVVAMFITRQAWHAYTSSELPRQLGLGVSLGVAVGLYWLADLRVGPRGVHSPTAISNRPCPRG